jgi:SAM-dependent methyltransferase
MNKEDLLREINAELPADRDWKAGAKSYLKACYDAFSKEGIEDYVLRKPLALIPPVDDEPARAEAVSYLRNFVEVVALIKLPGGAAIMDVACGGGWFSQWLSRLNYATYGFDISADFIEVAKRRISEDPSLVHIPRESIESMFEVHDAEAAPLPERLHERFDAAVLESCLHHFFDPVSAVMHIAQCLKQTGVAVIIEGENRDGEIKKEYMDEMLRWDTIERPYQRRHLVALLEMAGLPEVEFVAPLPGWFSTRDPAHPGLIDHHTRIANRMNLCVAGRDK